MSKLSRGFPLSICGLGKFATKRILPALAQSADFELVAVVDPSGIAKDLPDGVRRFTSLETFIEANPTGAVYVASPNFLHAQHSLRCLAAGLHVLCEKPMATNSIDCRTMIKAATDHNLILGVGHMLRYSPALELAKEWLEQGDIGELMSINAIFHYELDQSSRRWGFRLDQAGGGALMDAGVHCIDVIRQFITGPISVLTANTDRHAYEDGVERKAVCNFTAGNVNCIVDVNSQAPYKTLLTLIGINGSIVVDNFAATWGEVAVKIYPKHNSKLVKSKIVDTSTIYDRQLQMFAKGIAQLSIAAWQDISAADNVKVIEDLYSIS